MLNKRIALVIGALGAALLIGVVALSKDESSAITDIKVYVFFLSMMILTGFAGLKLAEITPGNKKLFLMPRWARILTACYAVSIAGMLVIFVITFPWFGSSVIEALFEHIYWYILVSGAIAFPFMYKYLK